VHLACLSSSVGVRQGSMALLPRQPPHKHKLPYMHVCMCVCVCVCVCVCWGRKPRRLSPSLHSCLPHWLLLGSPVQLWTACAQVTHVMLRSCSPGIRYEPLQNSPASAQQLDLPSALFTLHPGWDVFNMHRAALRRRREWHELDRL
jgi:hypothetical protein